VGVVVTTPAADGARFDQTRKELPRAGSYTLERCSACRSV